MAHSEVVMRIRFKSDLSFDQLMEIVEERAPEFEALSGLKQKYYLHDVATGEIAGLYIWKSREAMDAYRASELCATIAKAYQAHDEPDIEVYRVVKVLHEDG